MWFGAIFAAIMRIKTIALAAFLFPGAAAFPQDVELPHIITVVPSAEQPGETLISGEELERFSSVQDALESAGFSFKGTDNELTFHGYWNSSIKVYVNGVLMNDPNTGKFDFGMLDMQTVKSVRIDPASTDGAVSVYIRTFSADYTKPSARASLSAKSYIGSAFDSPAAAAGFSFPLLFDSGSALFVQEDVSVSRRKNHFGYRSADATYRPGFADSYSGYEKTYSGYEQFLVNNSLFASYSDARFPGASFGISSYVSYSDDGCGAESGYYFSEKEQKSLVSSLALPVFLPFENLTLNILPSYTYSKLDYTESGRFSFLENEYAVHCCSLQSDVLAWNFLRLRASASYSVSDEQMKSSARSEDFSHSLFTCVASPSVQLSLLGCSVSLALPVSYFHPSRSLELLYSLTVSRRFSEWEIFAHASRNVTNPVFQQLYYSGAGGTGNPDLRPESALSFYAGAQYRSAFSAGIKPFLILYRDKIGWTSSGGIWSPENVGSSVNWGADVSVSTEQLFSFFTLKAQYTLCRAVLDSGEYNGNQIMCTPVHTLSALLEVPLPKRFLWSASFRCTSRKYTDNANRASVPAFFEADTGLKWKNGALEFSLDWNNIFDFQYCHADGYPSPGTSVTARAQFLWQ